jgi:hypothetical protein
MAKIMRIEPNKLNKVNRGNWYKDCHSKMSIGFFSADMSDIKRAVANGVSILGPYYGSQDIVLDYAKKFGLPYIYYVYPDAAKSYRAVKSLDGALAEEQIKKIVTQAAYDAQLLAWIIGPEELRPWKRTEMEYLSNAVRTIKSYDPLGRPVFMYEPNYRKNESLLVSNQVQDVIAKGVYINRMGYINKRVMAKVHLQQMYEISAAQSYKKQLLPVLEMSVDPPDEYGYLIRSFTRHDAYLSLLYGSVGFLVWSAYRGRIGFEKYFDAYFDGYLSVANEINGTLALSKVLVEGEDDDTITLVIDDRVHKHGIMDNERWVSNISWAALRFGKSIFVFVVNSSNHYIDVAFLNCNSAKLNVIVKEATFVRDGNALKLRLAPISVNVFSV